MENFARHGFDEFVLCLGYRGEKFREYFGDGTPGRTDGGQELSAAGSRATTVDHGDWEVTLVDTGEQASKAARLLQVREHVDADRFFVTYGDGLADVDIDRLLERHEAEDATATLTGVRAPTSFGVLEADGNDVRAIREKPLTSKRINVGFFVFESSVFEFLDEEKSLERDVLSELAADGRLSLYRHDGFFRGIDTVKDIDEVRQLSTERDRLPWVSGEA